MAESEEPDFSNLSLEDKLTHKVWKARVLGYEEAVKLFKRLDDEKNPEYSKYVGLIKKFVTDSNAIAQEKALEATLVFVEYAACAGKVCADVVAGIVTKCLNARAKTKESAISVCLMYIEIEKQEIVQEEIMKGFTNKQPKIVAACVDVLTRALREFGSSVLNMKLLLKSLSGLFEHSDKNVRAEAKAFALEIYRWIGPTLTTLIKDKVKPVQLKELEEEIDKLPKDKVKPTRLLRSQQAQPPPTTAGDGDADEEEDEEVEDEDVGGGAQVDAYELLPAVNVLAQLPADFEENITHTKWQQRKEALETLLNLTGNPKIEPGEYGELMRMLKKVISKDTNVMLVALAGKAVTDLAKGLRKNFYPYASVMLTAIFEKFKEKKTNVVTALREAADAIYLTTSMSNIQEELVTAMANKNPAARAETLLFMARSFQLCTPDMLSKPFLKAICPVIITQLGDTTPQVRDASAEAFATVWKVMGDRPMAAHLEAIDKTKMSKIEEFKEKVEIKAVVPKASKPKKTATAAGSKPSKKPPAPEESAQPDKSDEPVRKPVKKKPPVKSKEPAEDSETPKEPPAKKPAKPKAAAAATSKPSSGKSKGKGKAAAANAVDAIEIPSEPNVANEEVEEKAKEVLPASMLTQLASSNWKERLAACEEFQKLLEGMEPAKIQSLLFVKVLGFLKPGWKDSNFQVMKAKFSLVSIMVTTSTVFGKRSTAYVLPVVVDKLADIKIKPQSIDTLMIMSEKFGLNFISTQVTKHAFEQKSPKVQSESLDWLSQAIKDFGFRIDVKSHIDSVKKALGATNPTVRSSGITLLGVMHMYIGPQLRVFFEGEKSALLAQIDAEFEKTAGESPPAPTRGVAAAAGDEDDDDDVAEEDSPSKSGAAAKPQSLADLMPKVDISGQIKSSLIKELADKNWKVRGEALQKVADILKEAKFIEPSLGDLPGALKGRLSDANKNLVVTTLNILSTIANAMGSNCVKYVKVLMPGAMNVLSDSKGHVRQAAIETLNAWLEQTGLACFVEGELFSTALATDSPYLRADLYKWLSEKLPEAGKLPSELSLVITPVFASLEDRSADVRKAAQLVLPPLTQHIGYDIMIKQAGKLKPASKQVVVGLLEKHKPTAPPPKSKAPASKSAPSKQSPSEAAEPATTTTTTAAGKKGKASAKPKAGDKAKESGSDHSKSGGGADDSEGGAPLVMSNKNQRAKDDQNLKMLKWNFASPRSEHVDQLKEQFVPCANAMLRSQLFHSDFKYHLVALNTLTQCIDEHNTETVANIDLILRWTTLRFFDTNTSVTLKCLEYLQSLFANLVTADYRMSDYEAYAFIPYLVLKVGDAKDPVRKGVRVLFGQLCCIYPPGKLFPYVVDGLKSKNSRQRSECLEELGLLIQNNGMVVCQPTPQKAVQVIAQQISDRDTNVRNAALNTLVVVYDNIGETVYKYAGQISPKDNGLLEERIKRAGKKPTASATAAPPPSHPQQAKMPAEDKQQPKHPKQQQQRHSTPVEDEEVTPSNGTKEEKPIPTAKMPAQSGMKPPTISVDPAGQEDQATTAVEPRPRVVTGPYKIDTSKYAKDSSIPTLDQGKWKDEHVDYSVIDEASNGIQTQYATSQLLINPPKTLAQSPARIASTSAAINYVISQITNTTTAETALHQMETYLTHADSTPSLVSHIDQLLRAVLMQLKATLQSVTQQSHGKEAEEKAMVLIKQLLSCVLLVFSEGSLAIGASQDVLEEVQQQIMGYLLDERLNKLEEVAQIHRTFNLIMSRMLENSNKNYLFGSLLHLLSQSLNADGESSSITQMIMKCLWKLTRKIPEILTTINVEELFLDLDKFFAYYTSLTTAPSDETPFRTVKTIIYHIVNIMGTRCMEHMTLIPKPKESAFWQYTRKSIAKKRASASSEEQQQQLLSSPSHSVKSHSPSPDGKSRTSRKPPETLKYSSLLSAKLPPGASKQLCDIFTAISSVERSKQGLLALHDFKQKYPEVDLTPIIQQNTKFLKGYIERGLKAIEQEKSGLPAHEHRDADGVDEYTARLQSIEQLRLKASASMNINNWGKAGGSMGSSIKPPGTSLPSQHMEKSGRENKIPPTVTTKSKDEEGASQETSSSSLNLIDVRKRLDKLKTKT